MDTAEHIQTKNVFLSTGLNIRYEIFCFVVLPFKNKAV